MRICAKMKNAGRSVPSRAGAGVPVRPTGARPNGSAARERGGDGRERPLQAAAPMPRERRIIPR